MSNPLAGIFQKTSGVKKDPAYMFCVNKGILFETRRGEKRALNITMAVKYQCILRRNKRYKKCGKQEDDTMNEDQENTNVNEEADDLKEYGVTNLDDPVRDHRIQLMTIIGEVEGHDVLPNSTKATKYEHVLPKLAQVEENPEVDGLLLLLNTMGGDVESGLAIAEMIASMSKPSVSLVLGGSHSIGVPLAVSTNYSFIVPTGTMVVHPVRLNGLTIGAPQTYDYFQQIQDRITGFVSSHCGIAQERLVKLMLNTGMLSKDLGTVLVGAQTVEEGLINEVGGLHQALVKLHALIDERKADGVGEA